MVVWRGDAVWGYLSFYQVGFLSTETTETMETRVIPQGGCVKPGLLKRSHRICQAPWQNSQAMQELA